MGDYSESIEGHDVKLAIHSKLNEYMEINIYQRSRSLFDLSPRSLRFH